MPRLETVENCMKVSQMIIQGLDQKSSPLLQLPHIKPEMLKHFSTKKVRYKGFEIGLHMIYKRCDMSAYETKLRPNHNV